MYQATCAIRARHLRGRETKSATICYEICFREQIKDSNFLAMIEGILWLAIFPMALVQGMRTRNLSAGFRGKRSGICAQSNKNGV